MQREIDAFNEALERPQEERARFVREKHAGDPVLVRRILKLLDAHERADRAGFETSPVSPLATTIAASPMPERIGPYRILEVIGEGGMGVVYSAEQREPLRRRVAIKVLKLGMDSEEVLARFEAERQAMALMDHPCVAKALDAGVTEQGRSYFVMELVKGLPLTTYCTKNKLPLRDRLRLVADVCAAIQHAHQKGVIHRDLKPSNILVTVQEGRPVPKVIDFGVAKATEARLTERTIFTEQGRLIGTPEYMSPEQAEMSGLDVDTRTDVYSIGVILYELLTGQLPFDSKALRSGGYPEILRIICEVDPPRPSTRLTELDRRQQSTPGDPGIQARSVRGELDWIVMRAIEKDRTRRYGTASALGEDIERFLSDRRVLAGPPGLAYGLKKFVKRHRYVTALIALGVLSAVIAFSGLTAGLSRAREAERLAHERADNAQAAASFLEKVLFQADPEYGGGRLTLLEVMDNAGRLIDEELGPFPEVEASVRESLGVAYRRRSMFHEAEPHLRRSLEIRLRELGEDHPETASAYIAMSNLIFEFEGDIDQSIDLLDRASEYYEAHELTGTAADAWLQLDIGIAHLAGDHLALAESAFERCRDELARHRGEEHPDVSRPVRGLALVALARHDLEEAERLARRAVELCEDKAAKYIGARAALVLAQVLIEADQLEEAASVIAKTGDRFSDTVGERHIRIAEWSAVLSELHRRMGLTEKAEDFAKNCERMRREMLRNDHWAILEARILRLRARIAQGERAGIEHELQDIADGVEDRLGADHPLMIQVAEAWLEYATAQGGAGEVEASRQRLDALRATRAERLRRERGA